MSNGEEDRLIRSLETVYPGCDMRNAAVIAFRDSLINQTEYSQLYERFSLS